MFSLHSIGVLYPTKKFLHQTASARRREEPKNREVNVIASLVPHSGAKHTSGLTVWPSRSKTFLLMLMRTGNSGEYRLLVLPAARTRPIGHVGFDSVQVWCCAEKVSDGHGSVGMIDAKPHTSCVCLSSTTVCKQNADCALDKRQPHGRPHHEIQQRLLPPHLTFPPARMHRTYSTYLLCRSVATPPRPFLSSPRCAGYAGLDRLRNTTGIYRYAYILLLTLLYQSRYAPIARPDGITDSESAAPGLVDKDRPLLRQGQHRFVRLLLYSPHECLRRQD